MALYENLRTIAAAQEHSHGVDEQLVRSSDPWG
jgi:hypothetical protein